MGDPVSPRCLEIFDDEAVRVSYGRVFSACNIARAGKNLGSVFGEPRNGRVEGINIEDRVDFSDARQALEAPVKMRKPPIFAALIPVSGIFTRRS